MTEQPEESDPALERMGRIKRERPTARPCPDFEGFAAELRSEVKWLATIHSNDRTGQSATDQDQLERLARKVEDVGKLLGYVSSLSSRAGSSK